MSFPYPQDRNRDRREKGEQPYKDAKEAMAESEAQIQGEAEAFGESQSRESEAERARRLEQEAQEAIQAANESLRRPPPAGKS